jgi:hypothetical protein
MSRFKVVSETDITVKDVNTYIDLRDYLKSRRVVKIDDKIFNPKIVKSESGNHLFEIYDEIKTKIEDKKSIRTLLNDINDKLDIILNIKR